MIAVAGHPLAWSLACQAAGQRSARSPAIAWLGNTHLILTQPGSSEPLVEIYHHRVAETITRSMGVERVVADHVLLAQTMEKLPESNAGAIAMHYWEGRRPERAGPHAVRAARRAAQVFAFETAVQFFRQGLDSGAFTGDSASALRLDLADALASAGHGAEAADIYLQFAEQSSGDAAVEFGRRAAQQYLIAGHIDAGNRVMARVLESLHISPPAGRLLTALRVLWPRLRLVLRRNRPRPAAAGSLLRIDACWSVVQGLAMVNTLQAIAYHALHLRLALDAGEPYRLARAVAFEAAFWAVFGTSRRSRADANLDRARQLAARVENPHAMALVDVVSGAVAFLRGEWADAHRMLDEAETALRERCSGVAWELATARLMGCVALFFLGDLRRLNARLGALLRHADARGDRYEATDMRIRIAHVTHLVNDEPATARRELQGALAVWPSSDFLVQHWWAMVAETDIDFYCGDGRHAWEAIRAYWGPLGRSWLLAVQYIRIESFHHRALAALAYVAGGRPAPGLRGRLLDRAARDASRLEAERAPWALACALSIRASHAAARSSTSESTGLFAEAEHSFSGAGMLLHAAAARCRRGQLLGGPDGLDLTREASEFLLEQGVRSVARFVQMLVGPDFRSFTARS